MGWEEGSEAGVLSGKPWEDHTAGLTSHSVRANTRKISPGWCQIPGSRLLQREKRYPLTSLGASRSPEILFCCKAMPTPAPRTGLHMGLESLPPQAQSKAKDTETDHPLPGQRPGSQRAPGGDSSNSPRCPRFSASQELLVGVRGLAGGTPASGPELLFSADKHPLQSPQPACCL